MFFELKLHSKRHLPVYFTLESHSAGTCYKTLGSCLIIEFNERLLC